MDGWTDGWMAGRMDGRTHNLKKINMFLMKINNYTVSWLINNMYE